MRAFLAEFVRGAEAVYTVIVMDEGYMEQPRRYQVRPFRLLLLWGGSLLGVALLAAAVMTFTPLRQLVPGYGTAQMEQNARANARRVAALEDSLRRQGRYMRHLQSLMTGPVDSTFVAEVQEGEHRGEPPWPAGKRAGTAAGGAGSTGVSASSPFAATHLPGSSPVAGLAGGTIGLDRLQFPMSLPAEGFVTRGFDAQTGHYAIDIATEAGTPVRSIGDGYVVMADRTEEGGEVIAVQHAGGYLSLYKHNRRLLKRVGERVEAREVIARSGNSGEITSGPHLHVELWQNGLAQDPAAYFTERLSLTER